MGRAPEIQGSACDGLGVNSVSTTPRLNRHAYSLPCLRRFAKVNFGLVVRTQLERDRPALLFEVTQTSMWGDTWQGFGDLPGLDSRLALK